MTSPIFRFYSFFFTLLTAMSLHSNPCCMEEVDKSIEMGMEAYKSGDYASTIKELAPLIDELKLNSVEDIIQTHSLLGASYLLEGDESKAKEHFEAVLNFERDHQLDRLFYPPKVISFFDRLRAVRKLIWAVDNLGKDIKPETDIKADATDESSFKISGVTLKSPAQEDTEIRNPYGNNFLPFGIAQFKNNSKGMGYFFTASQGTTFATALVTGILFAVKRQSASTPSSTIRGLKNSFLMSFPLFMAFYGIGVTDACLHYKEYPNRKEVDSTGISLIISPSSEKGVSLLAGMQFN